MDTATEHRRLFALCQACFCVSLLLAKPGAGQISFTEVPDLPVV